jgi:MSHA pilin protein MshD
VVTVKKILRHAGFTLLEIITTVVVIAIAATALMSVFSSIIRTSADPVFQHQALAIAEAYMEEILLKDFAIGPETTRASFDDVRDYNGLNDVGARDQGNNPIAGLTDYTISVTVVNDGLNGIAAMNSLRIDIVVSRALIDDILLSGYRTNY